MFVNFLVRAKELISAKLAIIVFSKGRVRGGRLTSDELDPERLMGGNLWWPRVYQAPKRYFLSCIRRNSWYIFKYILLQLALTDR